MLAGQGIGSVRQPPRLRTAGVPRWPRTRRTLGRMTRLAEGAAVIYDCVNPPCRRWPTDGRRLPPACSPRRNAAALFVTLSNLSDTAPRRSPWGSAATTGASDDRATPLAATGQKGQVRVRVWQDTLAAHQATRSGGRGPRLRFRRPRRAEHAGRAVAGGSARARTSRCSAAPTGAPWSFTTTWPGCWWWRAPTPGPGEAPGACRRTSRSGSARSSMTWPGPPTSVGYVSAPSPRPSFTGWDSSRRSCGTARDQYQFRADSSSIPRPPRRPSGLKPTPWEEIVAAMVRGAR